MPGLAVRHCRICIQQRKDPGRGLFKRSGNSKDRNIPVEIDAVGLLARFGIADGDSYLIAIALRESQLFGVFCFLFTVQDTLHAAEDDTSEAQSLGGEVELSYNWLGRSGFHARPSAGIKIQF